MNLNISFEYEFDSDFENVTRISITINNTNFSHKTINDLKNEANLSENAVYKFKKSGNEPTRHVVLYIKPKQSLPLDNNFPSSLDGLITSGLVHNEIIDDLYKLLSYKKRQNGGAFNDEVQDTETDEQPQTPPTLIKRRNKRKNKTMSKRDYIII